MIFDHKVSKLPMPIFEEKVYFQQYYAIVQYSKSVTQKILIRLCIDQSEWIVGLLIGGSGSACHKLLRLKEIITPDFSLGRVRIQNLEWWYFFDGDI